MKKAEGSQGGEPAGEEGAEGPAGVSQGVDTLLKAVSTQYRLSPRGREGPAENIARVLDSLGDQILPADR